MGGHGAWHIASHYPDRCIALMSLASWIKKEEYGDSNLFFRFAFRSSYIIPSFGYIKWHTVVLGLDIVETKLQSSTVELQWLKH